MRRCSRQCQGPELDCQLNAFAGFRNGAGGRREFILTLGLPLVAALDLRQFSGVLAHEFGHFTQGSGMRLSSFIRGIPDDFAAFVLRQEAQIPTSLRAKLERDLDGGARGGGESHPSDAERVRRARQRNAPGLIQVEGPAARLFGDFEVVSKQVTLLHYTEGLGFPSVTGLLTPVQCTVSHGQRR